ncbi:hypothetical protein OY671_008049, partial [Metschnikowia pulcherrima]
MSVRDPFDRRHFLAGAGSAAAAVGLAGPAKASQAVGPQGSESTLPFRGEGKRPMNLILYFTDESRADASAAAGRSSAMGVKPGDRIASVAETGPDFAASFCGTIYAGAWPVPSPSPTSFGGKDSYIDQLAVQLASSDPSMSSCPGEIAAMAGEAAARQGCKGSSWDEFHAGPVSDQPSPRADPDAI